MCHIPAKIWVEYVGTRTEGLSKPTLSNFMFTKSMSMLEHLVVMHLRLSLFLFCVKSNRKLKSIFKFPTEINEVKFEMAVSLTPFGAIKQVSKFIAHFSLEMNSLRG